MKSENSTHIITDRDIYEQVLQEMVVAAEKFIWIGTADIKDLHVKKGNRMVPFLEILSDLIGSGVAVRLMHAKEPGPVFRKDFDRYPNLINGMERMLCPRIHFKHVIVDGKKAYTGSANLTGAGMGAKSPSRRNFESGILTSDPTLVESIMQQFDAVWMGQFCGSCGRKKYCPDCPVGE